MYRLGIRLLNCNQKQVVAGLSLGRCDRWLLRCEKVERSRTCQALQLFRHFGLDSLGSINERAPWMKHAAEPVAMKFTNDQSLLTC